MSSDVQREPRGYTYCSFVQAGKCVGACILEGAFDAIQASKVSWRLGINPGGELMVITFRETDPDIPPDLLEAMLANVGRFVPVEEARELFQAKTMRELREELNRELD
jgi:hypothetical protein